MNMKEKYIINNIHNEKKKKKIKYINYKKFLLNDWKYKIKLFPKEIQRKLCIYTWRAYWRDYVPLIAKPPSWLSYHNFVQKSLWEARQKNIHFLHLPFNTLPENKKWIMGCQCDFCINDNTIDPIVKHMHYLTQYRNNNYFNEVFIPSGNSSNWNEYIYPINDNDDTQYMKIFDPLCGSYKENKFTKRLREGYKFEFSYPI
jgi:hypothetical protein